MEFRMLTRSLIAWEIDWRGTEGSRTTAFDLQLNPANQECSSTGLTELRTNASGQ